MNKTKGFLFWLSQSGMKGFILKCEMHSNDSHDIGFGTTNMFFVGCLDRKCERIGLSLDTREGM